MCLANDLACLGEGRPFPIDAFLDLAVVGVIGSALLTGALTRLIQRPPQHRWPLPGQVAGGAFAVGGVHGDVQTGEADRAAGGKTPAGPTQPAGQGERNHRPHPIELLAGAPADRASVVRSGGSADTTV